MYRFLLINFEEDGAYAPGISGQFARDATDPVSLSAHSIETNGV